jgi:RNA-directed DNA polymerase
MKLCLKGRGTAEVIVRRHCNAEGRTEPKEVWVNESYWGDNLKYRQLRIEDYLQKVPAEQGEYAEVCESPRITETDNTDINQQGEGLLEQILDRDNLNRAYKQVKRNRGASGIDGMQVDELLPYLRENKNELVQSLRDGKYRPKPVRRVEIPKENGKTRKLGIGTMSIKSTT